MRYIRPSDFTVWAKNLANFDPSMKIFHYQVDVINSFRNTTIKLLVIKKVFAQGNTFWILFIQN